MVQSNNQGTQARDGQQSSQLFQLSEQQIRQLQEASTPEEAYKRFVALASRGIGDVIATSLADAIGHARSQTSSARGITGWEQYVTGLCLSMDWGSPINLPASALVTMHSALVQGSQTPQQGQQLPQTTVSPNVTGSISVGVSVNF